ncbi:uncharacterized protein MONBRDRAFT_9891 [Monosiga brevicollis MX1]|uniref:Uncharacterized protein n=1 Tax=Monosiga brevicollis TaxID=81824 RepID=A9V4J3_MONBE|nr:uncharacterized protein MONBRDRAFT_9891 [Monosiga brevicollis MX1]EDQ87722.1 predicted protein [Monosiga brevicollis MX1]|eukprot:XP_001747642.1 hypothetical protein [Monosiga brevicollis MX1]
MASKDTKDTKTGQPAPKRRRRAFNDLFYHTSKKDDDLNFGRPSGFTVNVEDPPKPEPPAASGPASDPAPAEAVKEVASTMVSDAKPHETQGPSQTASASSNKPSTASTKPADLTLDDDDEMLEPASYQQQYHISLVRQHLRAQRQQLQHHRLYRPAAPAVVDLETEDPETQTGALNMTRCARLIPPQRGHPSHTARCTIAPPRIDRCLGPRDLAHRLDMDLRGLIMKFENRKIHPLYTPREAGLTLSRRRIVIDIDDTIPASLRTEPGAVAGSSTTPRPDPSQKLYLVRVQAKGHNHSFRITAVRGLGVVIVRSLLRCVRMTPLLMAPFLHRQTTPLGRLRINFAEACQLEPDSIRLIMEDPIEGELILAW